MTRPTIESPSIGDIFRPGGPGDESRRSSQGAATRGPRVLVLLHDDCARCQTWVRHELGAVGDDLRRWGGHIVRLESDFHAHHPEAAWLAVTDEWDEVFHVARIGPGHAFPDPADVAEWVRFVAIQCPECEGPEGPWRR